MNGKKYDQEKMPLVQGCLQYFPRALEEVARSSKFGHLKYSVPYSDQNWRKVEDGFNRYSDGLMRHLAKEHTEGLYDSESVPYDIDILHAGAVAWCALARLELLLTEMEEREESKK